MTVSEGSIRYHSYSIDVNLGILFWFKGEEGPVKIEDLCEEKIEEASAEEVVLQDLQRASEKVSVVDLTFAYLLLGLFGQSCNSNYNLSL